MTLRMGQQPPVKDKMANRRYAYYGVKIKKIAFIVITILFCLTIKISGCDYKTLIDKISNYYVYSTDTVKDINDTYNNFTGAEKECFVKYLLDKSQKKDFDSIYNCENIIVFFAFVKDRKLVPVIKKIYSTPIDNVLKAACEIYFSVMGINKDYYLNKYIERLRKSKAGEKGEPIIYAAAPIKSKKVARELLKKNANWDFAEDSFEFWLGIMTWVERDDGWWDAKNSEDFTIKKFKEYNIKYRELNNKKEKKGEEKK